MRLIHESVCIQRPAQSARFYVQKITSQAIWQRLQWVGNCCQNGLATACQLYGIAIRAGKPLSIETLNFARKKAQLSYAKPKTQQMLSSFAYTKFGELLKARAFDAGIEVVNINPAYSSKTGRQKYARRYGLSVHLAAALVLARRAQKFRDRYVSSRNVRPSSRRHLAATCKDRSEHVSTAHETWGNGRTKVVPHLRSLAAQATGDPRASRLGARAIVPQVSSEILEGESPGARVRPVPVATYPT